MTRKLQFEILQEILWVIFALIIAFAVLYPIIGILSQTNLLLNGFFIFAFVTYFRFTVFTKQIPFLRNNYVKGSFLMLNVGILLFALERLQYFFFVFDNYDNNYFLPDHELSINHATYFSRVEFFKKELVFFMVGFVILLIILQFRLLFSKWKRKKNT